MDFNQRSQSTNIHQEALVQSADWKPNLRATSNRNNSSNVVSIQIQFENKDREYLASDREFSDLDIVSVIRESIFNRNAYMEQELVRLFEIPRSEPQCLLAI